MDNFDWNSFWLGFLGVSGGYATAYFLSNIYKLYKSFKYGPKDRSTK